MASPRSILVEGASDIRFNDPSLDSNANTAIGTLLTLTGREYELDKGASLDAKTVAFQEELNAATEALFSLPPFNTQPGWVATQDQLPFQRGDNLLSMVYRVSGVGSLMGEAHESFTHDKVAALTKALLDKNVPADMDGTLEQPNPNSPLSIYMEHFSDLDTTHDFRVMELLITAQG